MKNLRYKKEIPVLKVSTIYQAEIEMRRERMNGKRNVSDVRILLVN